jgi:hypothetical protein
MGALNSGTGIPGTTFALNSTSWNSGTPNYFIARLSGGGYASYGLTPLSDTRGFAILSRTDLSSVNAYWNGTSYGQSIQTSIAVPVPLTIFGRAYNIAGSESGVFSLKACAFASIGDGLNSTEAANLYTAVQAYQTTLGRQLGTPVLAAGQTSNLLDEYSGSSAAYSLRKLKVGYYGFAIRVRRSSDNTEQNIGFDSNGGLDTASLLAFVGAGNGFVTTWYDQTSYGRHAYQTTANSQPQIVNNGSVYTINNKPSVYFNGSKLMETTTSVLSTGNRPYSIHGVSYNVGSAGSTLFYVGDASGNNGIGLQVINGGSLRHFWYTREFVSNSNSINLQTYYSATFDGTNVYTSVNNTTTNLGTGTKTTTNPVLIIGKTRNWNEYYNGYQQELFLFDEYNNTTTQSGIKSSINSYYSIY